MYIYIYISIYIYLHTHVMADKFVYFLRKYDCVPRKFIMWFDIVFHFSFENTNVWKKVDYLLRKYDLFIQKYDLIKKNLLASKISKIRKYDRNPPWRALVPDTRSALPRKPRGLVGPIYS